MILRAVAIGVLGRLGQGQTCRIHSGAISVKVECGAFAEIQDIQITVVADLARDKAALNEAREEGYKSADLRKVFEQRQQLDSVAGEALRCC